MKAETLTLSILTASVLGWGSTACLNGAHAPPRRDSIGTVSSTSDTYTEVSVHRLAYPLGSSLAINRTAGPERINARVTNASIYRELVTVRTESELAEALARSNGVLGLHIEIVEPIVVKQELLIHGLVEITTDAPGTLSFDRTGAFVIGAKTANVLDATSGACASRNFFGWDLPSATVLRLEGEIRDLTLRGGAPAHLIFGPRTAPNVSYSLTAPSLIAIEETASPRFFDPKGLLSKARFWSESARDLASAIVAPKAIDPSLVLIANDRAQHQDLSLEYCVNAQESVRYPADGFRKFRVSCERGHWDEMVSAFAACGDGQ